MKIIRISAGLVSLFTGACVPEIAFDTRNLEKCNLASKDDFDFFE